MSLQRVRGAGRVIEDRDDGGTRGPWGEDTDVTNVSTGG